MKLFHQHFERITFKQTISSQNDSLCFVPTRKCKTFRILQIYSSTYFCNGFLFVLKRNSLCNIQLLCAIFSVWCVMIAIAHFFFFLFVFKNWLLIKCNTIDRHKHIIFTGSGIGSDKFYSGHGYVYSITTQHKCEFNLQMHNSQMKKFLMNLWNSMIFEFRNEFSCPLFFSPKTLCIITKSIWNKNHFS